MCASSPVASAAEAASGALFPRTSFIDGQIATIEVCSVQSVNRFLRFFGRTHGDETEASRAASHPVRHEAGFRNGAMGGEGVLQVVFGGVEGKISYK